MSKTLSDDLADLAQQLLPVLCRYRDAGWPGLAEKQRWEATDAVWELETTLLELRSREGCAAIAKAEGK